MNSIDAYTLSLKASPELTEAERQFALTIAFGETGFGNWRPSAKTIELSKQFGLTGFEGVDSNNWGAVQGQGTAGSFPHVDTHADGTPYQTQFQKNARPEDGWLSTVRNVLKPNVREILNNGGGFRAAVKAMHDNGYFELDPTLYADRFASNYQLFTGHAQVTPVLSESGSPEDIPTPKVTPGGPLGSPC